MTQPRRLAGALLCLLGILSAAQPAAAEGVRRALLIGINEYASPPIPDLKGALNDIELVRHVLTTRYGFDAAAIQTVTNERATRAGILASLDALVAATRPGDFVYVHYSGHGSQVDDLNGDESDGLDETLVPHDGRSDGVPDITDDELYERMSRLAATGAVFVFDSCHSGTISRTVTDIRTRFVPRDERTDLYRRPATRDIRAVRETSRYVVLSGAPSDKEALDGPIDGSFYGLFTYSLTRALDSAGLDATPQDLLAGARTQLQRIEAQLNVRPPEPQLDAPPDRLSKPWLPGTGAAVPAQLPRRPWLQVARRGSDLVLLDGARSAASPGSTWAVYPPGETQFAYGKALATVRVRELRGDDAWLESIGAGVQVRDGARAVLLGAPPSALPMTAKIDAENGPAVASLRTALERLVPQLRFVGRAESARFVIAARSGSWALLDAGGLVMLRESQAQDQAIAAEELAQAMLASERASVLASLENTASDIDLSVRLVGQAAGSIPQMLMRPTDAPRGPGNSLMLEISADTDVYLTIASVDTSGGVNLLFPNSYQRPGFLPDGFVRSQRTVRIPDSFDDANAAGFQWDYGPTPGRDTIKVFAARDARTADMIRRFVLESSRTPEKFSRLGSDLVAQATRGVLLVPNARSEVAPASTAAGHASDWTAAALFVDVATAP